MKQNPKKGKVAASNLIALGNSSKPRYNNLSLASTVKKVKTDDLNPKTFLTSIDQTVKQENGGSEATLINFLNSIKTVLITSNKPIKTYLSQCLAIFVICKKYPSLFTKPVVLDCLVNILSYNGKESSSISSLANSFKPQSSTQVNPSSIGKIKPFHIAICNIILFSLKDVIKWPIQLVKAYLEDSFGDRIWVDLPECYLFVQNIETAFPIPGIDPRTLFPMSAFSDQMVDVINSNGDDKISIPTEQMDHSELRSCNALNKILTGLTAEELLKSRYDHCKPSIDAMIAGYIKDILDRRFMADTQSRPIIRTFCTLAAIPEVRGAAVAKSDNWLSTGKLQSSTLNMLTIMANSCAQNVMHNTHDVNFCAYFMLKFKYKLSKPPVQSILLECVRKITETHPCNLRNLLEIYINNEIYGTPTAAAAASNITGTVGNPCPIAYVPQNKSGPASVTFPAVYFRFPSESIKILGELLHEQISVLHHDIKPVKLFIRDICRWIKLAYINSNGVYTPFASSSSNGALPDSLELHDLAQNLLVDRSNSEALTSRMTDCTFKQLYVENMINIVCELQMLSTGKLQSSTLNMLTIMANSCAQNVMHNTHDVNFCAYFMLKFKYKLSKPPVQSILLECVRKITETHPCNLRNLLEIYINNEIYGTPTAAAAASNITGTVGNPCPIAYVPQNKSGPASVTFPAVYFRFPSESIKILGELLHEQISVLHHDIKPVKLFIRDICRWIKLAYINSNGVYTPFASSSSNGALPDSLELHDLAQNLLVDRSNSEALTSRMTDCTFKQLYVENMINIVCELQMLSVVRPTVREAFKERVDQEKKDYEALKSHFNTLRQIRYFTCKWLKNIFRIVESHVSADQMTNYIKQVLFLNVTRNNDFTYIVDESYGIGDIWNNETDKMFLVRGLTEIPISDKLVQTLINLGFEKNLCFRPSEIVNMISELIVRASASACTEIIPMNVSKCEAMINNMFACCSYDVVLHESDPNLQIARTLAYKSSFWKVCQALVVMASHCMTTVGALLWSNFPTVKNLMQIIITNNFDELSNDKEAMDKERQLCEIDSKKIIELESKISENSLDDIVMVDANSSKLVNLLLFNLPQGPIRQPPSHIVESLKSINQIMKIGDRLSQCRNPDFLFEIVREQDQNKISSRKWIIDLVKKTSEHNLDCLPLLVLTEFIYHDIYEKIINNLPVVSRNDTKDGSLKRLVHKLRSILCVTETDKRAMDKETLKNIVGALSNSFFNRLSDSSAFIRKVARECLYILLLPISHPIKLMEFSLEFVDTLKSIMNLNILQDNSLICSVAEALRETLKFETDIDVLHSYIDLFALMSTGNHKEWLANTVETLSILILNRPIIADKLRTADNETLSKGKTSTTLICDSLAEIFLAHINYTAYQAKVVPLEHREEAVMVTIKDKQFPVVVKVIQSQLALACWGVSKSKKSKKLIDFWFCKVNTSNKYQLTSFTNIESNAPVTDIIPDWLVNAAVHSGIVSVMSGILNHHVAVNGKISHSLTPALYFMSNDFIKSYLNYMNSIVKSELTMIETWLSQCSEKLLSGMLATVTRMYSKVVKPAAAAAAVDILFKTTLETHHHHLVPKYQNLKTAKMPNLEPKIIVKPIENRRKIENPEITARMEIDDIDNVWSTVVQAYSIGTITECISKLLASKSIEIVKGIENLFKLLKDPKTHSETLKILNKSDFKLMPLLKLSFRSYDQESFDFGMQSFRYLFKSYPHIEKSSLWKMIYNLSLVQGLTVGNIGNVGNGGGGDVAVAVAVEMSDVDQYHHHHHQLQWKSLAKSIMQGGTEDAGQIGPKIDQLTILGLGNGHFTESHFDLLHKLLFSSHSLNQYSDYFMSDLLHQSNAFCLRQILHSILNRKTITQLNASRVLDFITACLHHPRLQYSVVLPVSNQYIWPQQNSEIDLSESELIALLNLVVCEAEHLIEQNGPTAKCVNRSLVKRSDLIDICSSSKSLFQQRNLIINRFIDWKSPHNEAVDKFGFALYCRLPNLISDKYQAATNNQQQQQQPMEMEREKEALTVTDVDRYNLKEIHRIGQRLLAGLVSPRNDLQDMAIQGCKALVTKHPKLSLQLLPYMCALSDGALDGTDSWNEFRKKRSPVLYSNLLHLLEIMIPVSNINSTTSTTIRGNMKIILFNFLRVLIRYRDEHKFFIGFVTRLVGFMEKMIPLEKKLVEDIVSCCCEEEVKNENREEKENGDFIIEHATEITALSKIYPQFRNLIVYVQKNKEICSSLLSASSTGELDDNRASQLPLLKLELLVNFRKKLRETLTGNGILMQIKDLDDVSRRDTNIIGLFLDDLRRLINHSMNDVRIAAVQVLARYLNAFPEQANRIIGDFILSNMLKSVSYWSRPFVNLTLKTLCQTGMLTPNVVPLCLTNHARLYVTGNNGRGNYRESIELLEVIIDNISLESFMESVGSYNGKPMLKKDNINQAQKRGFLDNDGDSHKAKRSRFK